MIETTVEVDGFRNGVNIMNKLTDGLGKMCFSNTHRSAPSLNCTTVEDSISTAVNIVSPSRKVGEQVTSRMVTNCNRAITGGDGR